MLTERTYAELHVVFENAAYHKTRGYVGTAVFSTHLATVEHDGKRWTVSFPFEACPVSPELMKRVRVVVNRLSLGRCVDLLLDGSGKTARIRLSGEVIGKAEQSIAALFGG
jgi:hypothetical protein